ncbi:MFS transporter [Ruminococcus sp.]|uniref:MFS transporter n=1 Tax=Ruminococcus sp. TaxID=41978 RepID=UPI002E77A795|nr:MFS transporter [Ruminococcus sp.]MEE1398220.1 MFS transporter [Ruminococcus sp.]
MSQSKNYQKTMYACFIGYIVQAVVNNFVPLLFVVFQDSYHIPLSQITALITINFLIQLGVDLLSAGVVDKLGYRTCVLIAHGCVAVGLVLLAFLPDLLPNPFAGILIAVGIYAVGGGLIEVLISPILEACPTKNKEKAMSLLHSFYCWGHVGVVLISTVFFRLAGVGNWRILTVLWALIPVGNLVLFAGAPIYSLHEEGETGLTLRELFQKKIFWILMLMMMCAGASEQAVSQWASIFAEKGLGVSKTVGDLAGPMAFAALMGTSRLIYGKYGDRLNLNRFMTLSCFLCIAAYGCISLIPNAAVGLAGCAVCGFSVGILWPGTFSKASAAVKGGGTAMFALLALAGDLGCSGGPTLAGAVSSQCGDNLRMGILAAVVFPVLLLAGMLLLSRQKPVKS